MNLRFGWEKRPLSIVNKIHTSGNVLFLYCFLLIFNKPQIRIEETVPVPSAKSSHKQPNAKYFLFLSNVKTDNTKWPAEIANNDLMFMFYCDQKMLNLIAKRRVRQMPKIEHSWNCFVQMSSIRINEVFVTDDPLGMMFIFNEMIARRHVNACNN